MQVCALTLIEESTKYYCAQSLLWGRGRGERGVASQYTSLIIKSWRDNLVAKSRIKQKSQNSCFGTPPNPSHAQDALDILCVKLTIPEEKNFPISHLSHLDPPPPQKKVNQNDSPCSLNVKSLRRTYFQEKSERMACA